MFSVERFSHVELTMYNRKPQGLALLAGTFAQGMLPMGEAIGHRFKSGLVLWGYPLLLWLAV
jgi:hypothetical protein